MGFDSLLLKNQAFIGVLLILVGLVTVPIFKETIGRILLFALFAGILIFAVAMVVGGIILIALRGSS